MPWELVKTDHAFPSEAETVTLAFNRPVPVAEEETLPRIFPSTGLSTKVREEPPVRSWIKVSVLDWYPSTFSMRVS